MKRCILVVVVASTLALAGQSAGEADDGPPTSPPLVIGGEAVEPGADATIVIPESDVDEARNVAVADGADLTRAEASVEDELIEASEEHGGSLDEESIDVVSLLDGDVILAVPVTIEVTEVTVDIEDTTVDVSAATDETDEAMATGSGPGMAAPYWGSDGDGAYVLTVRGLGDALFTWERFKLQNDGDSDHVWYSYRRKGSADPFSRSGPDAKVATLRIQSYPYDEIEDRLLNWVDLDPASDFSGDGDGQNYTIGISVSGVPLTFSFADQDKYTIWRNANNPGSYWMEMDQGWFIHGGSREAAYIVSWKAEQGTPGSQHDFQRVVFYYNSGDYRCDEYDAGDFCEPNGVDH